MKYLSVLLVCLCLTSVAVAQEPWRVDAAGGTYYKHQVIELPQDHNKCYCTLMGDTNDPAFRQLVSWFDTTPELAQLKSKTHFHVMDTNSVMYKKRYAQSTGQTPCVRIQQPDGTVIFQCSDKSLPLSGESLANMVSASCFRRQSAQPSQPQPYNHLHVHYDAPDTKSDKVPDATPQPDVFANHEVTLGPAWFWILMGACVVSVLTGVGYEWRRSYAV